MKKSHLQKIERFAAALPYAGSLVLGIALGTFSLVSSTSTLQAGEANFVRGSSHDAIAGVRLDESITIRFKSALWRPSVGPDTIRIRTGSNNSEQARGEFITGKFMYDRSAQRRVVIRPEAIREYFQLVRGLNRSDAQRKATRYIERLERTGRFRNLAKIDRQLVSFFGPSFGAGTRLDADSVTGIYPPQLLDGDSLAPYRLAIAGDDAVFQDYLINGNLDAFPSLQQNSNYERFFHPTDAATGVPAARSVLRDREYRRVLIDRRNTRRVSFIPNLPIRADLEDSGFQPGKAYSIVVPASQPGVFNTVLTAKGRRPLLQDGGRDFSTLFTTVPGTVNSSLLYLGGEARTGVAAIQKPRVINMTPPNGEAFIDASTDWEDPDNQFEVPLQARKTFTVRLRFAQPIDPRTVNPTNFTITKTKTSPGTPGERVVNVPVAVGTFLNQNRLGIVEVEVTPATNLDPSSQYDVIVRGSVRTLGSLTDGTQATLGTDFRASFIVGAGPIPTDGFDLNFDSVTDRADPTDPDTFGQQTTAMWRAPELFDPEGSGKLVAAFMPFLGFGEGAPAEPGNPVPFDPNDPTTFPVTNLALAPGESLTWVTEGLDPGDPDTFGQQIEYEYQNVQFNSASASVIGRYPLVVRSQQNITLLTSAIFVNGSVGGTGVSNTDTISGGPQGGLGGAPGPGGFRGGDGAMAPLTDANGQAILDSLGNLQPDPNKYDGVDGFPGYVASANSRGGAGAGGFSGDQEGVTATDPVSGNPVPAESPDRTREPGGGGAHATAGGNGSVSGGTRKTHPDGHFGGRGGQPYGVGDMSDQPINAQGAPVLRASAGGAGGGGGGGEDDANVLTGTEDTAGPEDAGGGGGGGGGGAMQLVARNEIRLDSSILDASGGIGGRTFDATLSDFGEGAPGGCGAGGTIWLQCFGEVLILNGSTVSAAGGVGNSTNNGGQVSPDPPGTGFIIGTGGIGGDGFLRFEDADGTAVVQGSSVIGVRSDAVFRPNPATGDYPAHPGVPMVVNNTQAYSRWLNSQLDTPSFVAIFDDPLTPAIDGTSVFEPAGHSVDILVRTAPGDVNVPGRPNLGLATPWTPLADIAGISDRRFVQVRVDFAMPLSFTFDQARPYVDRISISVELQ